MAHRELNTARQAQTQDLARIHRALGERPERGGPEGRRWPTTHDQALTKARHLDPDRWVVEVGQTLGQLLATAEQGVATLDRATERVSQLEREFTRRGGWSRFFLVPGGHIHNSRGCHTLRATTVLGWLPDLSGQSEEQAVAAHGPHLCTVCFPSAPTDWCLDPAQAKAADPARCPGSGQQVTDANMRLRSPRGTCPECAQAVSVTSLGRARAHRKAREG